MKHSRAGIAIVSALALTTLGVWADAGRAANVTTSTKSNSTLVASFMSSMKRADGSPFVLTYHVGGYLWLSYGKIVIAQIPSPPGTKLTTNAYGFTGSGRMAYLFHGPTGRIVQWIQNGTNVSACVNALLSGTYDDGVFGKLECSRPSPFIPSNGFALEGEGFVPTYVDTSLTSISPNKTTVTTRSSPFGILRCLIQVAGTSSQTTCINHAGFIVTWFLQNGMGSFSRAILSSLKRDPTASDFKTLLAPTEALILPPV